MLCSAIREYKIQGVITMVILAKQKNNQFSVYFGKLKFNTNLTEIMEEHTIAK